jgi:flagellar biosynthetic protein FlhB
MADDRTEKPTPKRRNEARKKGQVAKSADLNGALVLLAGLFAISLLGPKSVGVMETSMREGLANVADPHALMTGAGLGSLFSATLRSVALGLGPLAAVCLAAGVLANVGQVGIRPATHALKPDPKKLNPVAGAKNLFGMRMFFEGGKSIAKVSVVGVIVALALAPKLTQLASTVGTGPAAIGAMVADMVFSIVQRAALAYLAIGAIDYAYQRWRHEKGLRMSKQEVKQEVKQHALPAEVRGALRRRQLQAARARMMAAVPQADVVIVNPTHFAVALRYDGLRPAPEVVAKGQDLVALQIRKLAEEHDVPIVENKPLARSLHKSVEIGQLVPEELYQAVAQVLAYVYRVAGRRASERRLA